MIKTMKFVAITFVMVLINTGLKAQNESEVTHLAPKVFQHDVDSTSAVLIDVRPWDSKVKKSIENAIHISDTDELKRFLDTLDKDKPVYFYCDGGFRSNKMAKVACAEGFTHVYDLDGGMFAWKDEKLPIKKVKKND